MKLLVVQCDTTSWLALATTKPHIKCVPGALFSSKRWPEREPNHSPLSNAEVKNEKICTSASYTFVACTRTTLFGFTSEFIDVLLLVTFLR